MNRLKFGRSGTEGSNDFRLFGAVKNHLTCKQLVADTDMKQAVASWLRIAGADLFWAGLQTFVPWWDKCFNVVLNASRLQHMCHDGTNASMQCWMLPVYNTCAMDTSKAE